MDSPISDIGDNLFVAAFDSSLETCLQLLGKADRLHEQVARGAAHGALVAAVQYAVYRGDVDIASVIAEATACGEAMRAERAAAES